MARIRELTPEVYRKIAAGEVVERPLSVVKELVENALDAGADQIHVELGDGGRRQVRVSDNGHGFAAEDIPLAFRRHTTSKLAVIDDLDQLTSLGFRGEALASICEVARIELVSATTDGAGARMRLEPGGEPEIRAVSCPRGTRITVSDLFFNFPVRRKFLKSARTETNRVATWMEAMALAWWSVTFRLDHNGRNLFTHDRTGSLAERVYQVLGRDTAAALAPLEAGVTGAACRGLVSRPRTGSGDRRRQFFFVNRRPVREATIMAALNNAAAPFLEKGRHPVAVLLLDISPQEVDVNIHPMKLEIRFRDQQAAYRLVYHAVTAALGGGETRSDYGDGGGHSRRAGAGVVRDAGAEFPAPSPPAVEENRLPFPAQDTGLESGRVLGQYRNAYIVMERRGELLLVDQHNAHERVLYDRLRRQAAEEKVETAVPLFPMVVELSVAERHLLETGTELLAGLGFEVEPLGGGSVAVRRYPRLLPEARIADALREAVRCSGEPGENPRDDVLAGVACKAAIKVNQPLSLPEMQRLVDDLFGCENPEFCPHRRPIIVHLTLEEIEKRVRRR